MKTFIAYSSVGEVEADKETGLVVRCSPNQEEPTYLPCIFKFDIDEYKEYHKVDTLPDTLDIVSIGDWAWSGDELVYTEPSTLQRELWKSNERIVLEVKK